MNNAGETVDQILRTLPEYRREIIIDNYIVMPNHIHIIIQIVGAGSSRPGINKNNNETIDGRDNRARTLGQIIAYFKYNSTKKINELMKNGVNKIWQRSFYDHIIRNDKSLHKIREYIVNNPLTWNTDKNNPNNKK